MFKQLVKLFICSSVLLSSTGLIFATAKPTQASAESDQAWRQYFGGRMIVSYSSYSSGGGSGGFSGRSAGHFCSNGVYAFGSSSSLTINTDGTGFSGHDSDEFTGTWRIVESEILQDKAIAIVQLDFNNGETYQTRYEFRADGRLYSPSGKKALTGKSDVCE
jgi:hypothetical protein